MARARSAAASIEDVSAAGERRLRAVGGRAPARRHSGRLSNKELLVLRELAQGHTTEQIADILQLSPHTVRTHVKNGMRKLDARTRAHAVAIALSDGVITLQR